ncbi:hypothetical protein [Spirulina sp. 06S082]|uniref:hypothetical protein n=1 Tax=Spirulina sp. 06S082 TaxID=3110248 RepID=UPI002B1FC99C|nr:hypothetical protein [Spirulina sp. 06S082]MEA5467940.1 hypothetical protein [Spirulina sp. 06S082]
MTFWQLSWSIAGEYERGRGDRGLFILSDGQRWHPVDYFPYHLNDEKTPLLRCLFFSILGHWG